MKVSIVGGGTAGLIAAICVKSKMPLFDVSIIESSRIGIIGVGEGSTEHWKLFCNDVGIDLVDLILNTDATHKQGIRFENWTTHTPDYFHSVGYMEKVDSQIPVYEYLAMNGKLLTNNLAHPELINNCVVVNSDSSVVGSVNQYHFDTFKLNQYFHKLCSDRGIEVIDDTISRVELHADDGFISCVHGEKNSYSADFWIDATGFNRILSSAIDESQWVPASEYLLVDRAIPFPTGPDESGAIRPYTRARAASAGWIWEIPTQKRRGNGYVFSSSHISVEQACNEIEKMVGVRLEEPRVISYNSGHLDKMWTKNCVSIGLSGSFVEPLEATSISTAIQQSLLLGSFLPTYKKGSTALANRYNKIMDEFHQNLISMISLHYISDRRDSQFWVDCSKTKKPEYLENMLALWSERPPQFNDLTLNGYELFHAPHFWHVAQGQGLVSKELCELSLMNRRLYTVGADMLSSARKNILAEKVVEHGALFK